MVVSGGDLELRWKYSTHSDLKPTEMLSEVITASQLENQCTFSRIKLKYSNKAFLGTELEKLRNWKKKQGLKSSVWERPRLTTR